MIPRRIPLPPGAAFWLITRLRRANQIILSFLCFVLVSCSLFFCFQLVTVTGPMELLPLHVWLWHYVIHTRFHFVEWDFLICPGLDPKASMGLLCNLLGFASFCRVFLSVSRVTYCRTRYTPISGSSGSLRRRKTHHKPL